MMIRYILALCLLVAGLTVRADEKGRLPFVWGAEVGTGIDMGSDDMSTLNVEGAIGWRNSWIRMLGIGAGIDVAMSNSTRCFPIYAIFRSSFFKTPILLFGDLRVGIAHNQTDGVPDRTNFFIRPGLSIELAKGKTFCSYLSLAYTYNSITFQGDKAETLVHGLNQATVSIGVMF